ncbi:transcription factor GTE8 isoform X2 [Ricinus communis]|uniref:transcription factor GTE8 isoform X2 n=1 Tax=Ricinus communis TaxID=3988 RepID=UPI00201A4BC7|nr:transcription factor GTE8 isoform X2 [Ricinus communis]
MMMERNDKFRGGFYRNTFETVGELEGSGSSGRIDTEITASEDSSAPTRKRINLNSNKQDSFGVPLQVLSFSRMSSSERKNLIRRLRFELEQIRLLQKKLEVQKINAVTLSSSSDILSCSNGTNGPRAAKFNKSAMLTSGPVKKANPSDKIREWNRSSSGRFKSTKQPSAPLATNMMVMKQCETLLSRLMSHQYGWVFKEPVDVVKLNIPDYYTIIKHPMDLGTIKSNICSGLYSSPLEFLADVRLTFRNAMEYNPKGSDVHIMADTLSKFFEVRWKAIEKKLPKIDTHGLPSKSGPREDLQITEISPIKKRKISSYQHEIVAVPVRRVMTDDEKQKLGKELESLLGEMPIHIIDFLKDHSSNGRDAGEDEIEIDIDDLSDDTLFTLRRLLDDYLLEKQKSQARVEPCEIELLNESGLSNSSMQQQKADEDVDIGGNEPPVSSYPPVEIEKDTGNKGTKCISSGSPTGSDSDSSSESDTDAKALSPTTATKVNGNFGSGPQLDDKTSAVDLLERNQSCPESVSGLDQLEQTSQQKPSSVESDCCQDDLPANILGDSAPNERQVSPDKLFRAAMLKNRFAETILKAREKTLSQVDKGDPEKLRREKVELELQKKKEKARLQAEAKAAEDARKQAEAAAAAEARRKRELEREAARQALLKMEKTVEINENSQLLEDLEMLRAAPVEHLPSSVDETSPVHSQDGLGGFKFGGSNPLEQLGLFMKQDEEEEEGEPLNILNPVNDMEEGEID